MLSSDDAADKGAGHAVLGGLTSWTAAVVAGQCFLFLEIHLVRVTLGERVTLGVTEKFVYPACSSCILNQDEGQE